MFIKKNSLFIFVAMLFFIGCNDSNEKKAIKKEDTISHYQLEKNWPQLPDGFLLGNPTGIGIDTGQNIFIFHRAGRKWPLTGEMPDTFISAKTILMLDRNTGKILNSWGDNFFIMPHGLTVDINNNIWVTDVALHQVFKFSHEGKLLLALGEAKNPGNDATHFNLPTDVAIAKDGSFYVSDGYGNSRVVKFSAEGKYLFAWGKKGNGEAEFDIPHGIALDEKGNVYVADRENKRVQVFDAAGKFIAQWKDKSFGRICGIAFNKERNEIAAADDATSFLNTKHNGSDVILFNSAGNVLSRFGRSGYYNGPKCWYHDIAMDKEGNIYVGDILGDRIQKFTRAIK